MLNRALPIRALYARFCYIYISKKFKKRGITFNRKGRIKDTALAQQLVMGDNPKWFQDHQLKTARSCVHKNLLYMHKQIIEKRGITL